LRSGNGAAAATDTTDAADAADANLCQLLFRDGYFAAAALLIAMDDAHSGAPVHLYRFDYVLSLLRSRRSSGAHRGSKIPYVFDTLPRNRPCSAAAPRRR
jgi:carboxylesterase type B